MRRPLVSLLSLLLVCWPMLGAADEARTIFGNRITLGDVVHGTPALDAVDLGPAPPPGGSRLFGRGEIEDKIRAAGLETKGTRLPPSVRVVSASQRVSPDALAKLATPAVERALPPGVTLTKVQAQHELVTMPGIIVRAATIPRLPRQKGTAQSTAMLELVSGAPNATDVMRIPVTVTVEISESAARADVPRGSRLEVVFEHGAVKIATVGIAAADAEIGELTNVTLTATSHMVRAKVLSKDRAEIVEHP